MSYVDLHCHLLPGIDDGAATPGAALDYARRLQAEGVSDVMCTPHVKRSHFPRVDVEALAALRRRTQEAIDAEGLPVRLHPGGELAHEDALALSETALLNIAGGPPEAPWLLLECPFEGVDGSFPAAVDRLRGLGFGLLLAHPERSPGFAARGLDAVGEHLGHGVALQVNVCSLLGNHGLPAQGAGFALLRRGLVSVLASDAHPGTREHTLQLGFHVLLRAGMASPAALALTQDNPRQLLERGVRALDAPDPARLAA